MDDVIFCPTCRRFVGLREKCSHCQWTRPAQPSPIGQVKWQARLSAEDTTPGTPPFPARIASGDGLIFVPTETGEITALDAETGRTTWQRPLREDRKLRTLGIAVWKDVLLMGTEHLADLPTRDRALLAWDRLTGEDAWNWPTLGDSLSIPVVHQDVAYFASSEPRLYAFHLQTRQLIWSAPSHTWSPDLPAVSGDVIVAPSRGPRASAYSTSNGARLWTFEAQDKESEWLHQRPAVTADTAFLSGWDKRLYAVDLATGQLRWRFQAERGITCPPVLAGDKLLIGVKNYRTGLEEHKPGYGLYALDTASGQMAWKLQTDKHIHISPATADDVILCGADDRRLRALDARDGHELWQVALPEKLRAGPHIVGQHVVVGQRNGELVCIQWNVAPTIRPDPGELLLQGRPLEAAAELALAGQYEAAARLFEEHGAPEDAASLYLEANQLSRAAAIHVQRRELDQALSLYRQAGNPHGEADVLAQQNKHDEAAPLYESLGDLDKAVREYIAADRAGYAAQLLRKAGRRQEAARLYQSLNQDDQAAETLVEDGRHAEAAQVFQGLGKHEVAAGVLAQGGLLTEAAALNEQLGRIQLAADLYAQAGQADQALRLYEQLQDWKRVAELAEAVNDLPRQANAQAKLGQMAQAAQVYERAGLLDQALTLYQELSQWDKVKQIAGQLERWEQQAQALMQAGLVSEAGEAYERAAEQLQTRSPQPHELARLYESAAGCYAQDENWNRQQACWDKVCRYRQWPNLRGRIQISAPFFQGEYSQIQLVIKNIGYSMARNTHVSGLSSKFRWDSSESDTFIPRLARLDQQQERTITLSLQPRDDVLGRVNLRIKLSYQDPAGQTHEEDIVQSVEVTGRDEKIASIGRQTPTPVTPAQVINVQGGRVVVGGALIEGDRAASRPDTGPLGPGDQGIAPIDSNATQHAEQLRFYHKFVEYFSDSELREICFEFGVEYENLSGDTKNRKASDLVGHLQRRGQYPALVELCRRLRPKVEW